MSESEKLLRQMAMEKIARMDRKLIAEMDAVFDAVLETHRSDKDKLRLAENKRLADIILNK